MNSLKLMFKKTLLAFLAIAPSLALAAGMDPILPLPRAETRVPLVEESLRDPSLVRSALNDDLGFESLDQDIAEATADLPAAKGARRLELLKKPLS